MNLSIYDVMVTLQVEELGLALDVLMRRISLSLEM